MGRDVISRRSEGHGRGRSRFPVAKYMTGEDEIC